MHISLNYFMNKLQHCTAIPLAQIDFGWCCLLNMGNIEQQICSWYPLGLIT